MDLLNYYKLNFQLKQHHQWSLFEIESLLPWEREVYVGMLKRWIDEENEKIKRDNQRMKHG